LRHRSRNYNSPESRKKRSDRARKGAEATNAIKASKRDPYVEPIQDLLELTVRNLVTGKVTVLTYHPGRRRNNMRIEIDGQAWKTCGMVEASKKITESIFKTFADRG
jgi:hypothetical protein